MARRTVRRTKRRASAAAPGRDLLADLDHAFEAFHEMIASFRAMSDLGPAITIYGSARLRPSHAHYQLARRLGSALAKAGFAVITGGGPGIMEAGNRGAREAGGLSLGFNIKLPFEQSLNRYCDRSLSFESFPIRKLMLRHYSQGFVLMPGGLGSLDEIFETATLIQTRKLERFPIVLMGVDYWTPIADALREVMLQAGTVSKGDFVALQTDSVDEAVAYLKENAPTGAGKPRARSATTAVRRAVKPRGAG